MGRAFRDVRCNQNIDCADASDERTAVRYSITFCLCMSVHLWHFTEQCPTPHWTLSRIWYAINPVVWDNCIFTLTQMRLAFLVSVTYIKALIFADEVFLIFLFTSLDNTDCTYFYKLGVKATGLSKMQFYLTMCSASTDVMGLATVGETTQMN